MQRKITSIILLIMYLTANIGYSLDMHYMDGKLMNANIGEDASCMMECKIHSNNATEKHFTHTLQEHLEWMENNNQKNSGCSDHEIQIKIDAPQLDSKQEIVNTPFLPVLFVINHFELVPQFFGSHSLSMRHTVTVLQTVPIYISFQRLIFYS